MLALTACKCSPRRALPSSQVLAGTAGALRNLTVTDEIAKHIALAGGLEALIAAAEAHPESAEVQSEAAGALWGLAITEEIAEAICAKGGIKVLTTALDKAGAEHLDMHACAHHGAIPPAPQVLVKAGAAHLDKPRVLARVSGALRKLSANSEHKHEVIAALMASD
jgi:hypothetical protein